MLFLLGGGLVEDDDGAGLVVGSQGAIGDSPADGVTQVVVVDFQGNCFGTDTAILRILPALVIFILIFTIIVHVLSNIVVFDDEFLSEFFDAYFYIFKFFILLVLFSDMFLVYPLGLVHFLIELAKLFYQFVIFQTKLLNFFVFEGHLFLYFLQLFL